MRCFFFPLQTNDIAHLSDEEIYTIVLHRYNMCLFLHKNNTYAKYKENQFNWDILSNINIVPINKQFSFSPYLNYLTPSTNYAVTDCADLSLLYQGLINNKWVVACGEEFATFYRDNNIVIKKVWRNKSISTDIHWCMCAKQNNQKKIIIHKLAKYLKRLKKIR